MRLAINSAATLLSAFSLFASNARADVLPPEVGACQGKPAGGTCSYVSSGVCQNQTCSQVDYSNWYPDASSAPPTITYACVWCATDTHTGTVSTTSTGTSTGTSTATATGTGTVDSGTSGPVDSGMPTALDSGVKPAVDAAQLLTKDAALPLTPDADTTAYPPPTASDAATTTKDSSSSQPAADAGALSTSGAGPAAPTADHGSSCSVARQTVAKRVAPWLVAGVFSTLFLFGRRRRR